MNYDEAIAAVAAALEATGTEIDTEAYDGIIVKKLAATNTLGDGRGGTHQAHIAITGTQMDIFPYVRSESYFVEGDGNMKRYFVLQMPVEIRKTNVEYLAGGPVNEIAFTGDKKDTYTTALRSHRNDDTEQVELSTVRTDHPDFIAFRRLLTTGTYLVFLKLKGKFEYTAVGVKEADATGLTALNGNFYYKTGSSTAFRVGSTITQHYDATQRLDGGNNTLLYGVPGSGKSWTIEHEYCHPGSAIERLVFHPDYTNADFVGQILPVVDEDRQVTYEFTPGPFTSILKDAYFNPMREHVLIIEEINRGNAPAIFGEIFQLLDRKVEMHEGDGGDPIGTSEYGVTHKYMAEYIYGDPKHKVKIPSNLSIIGTMNTSDQNVFTLDTAFQRRWRMRLIENNFENVRDSLAQAEILDTEVSWQRFCETVNGLIVGNKVKMASAEDKRLGVYFVHESDLAYDDRMNPSDGEQNLLSEYNGLLALERTGDIPADKAHRLKDIRESMIHNRQFPEKVIKYLWDDAFKFYPEALFDTGEGKMDSLEKVIRTFIYESGRNRFKILKDTVRDKLYE